MYTYGMNERMNKMMQQDSQKQGQHIDKVAFKMHSGMAA
jgi:hypothetical protein